MDFDRYDRIRPIRWQGDRLSLLDQRKLPFTVEMMDCADSDAVVDPRLRVHGVDGLRVADGSIMPMTVNSQTHAACVMIGEKVSESIIANR